MSRIELKHLLIALVAGWAVCCVMSRGPAILAYIAMQAATSGVFAYAILKSLKKQSLAEPEEKVLRLSTEPVEARPQATSTATPQAG
ncbi:hypothetical protein OAH18_03435 [bacterium]|nr:hypothetical protein [bacterium]